MCITMSLIGYTKRGGLNDLYQDKKLSERGVFNFTHKSICVLLSGLKENRVSNLTNHWTNLFASFTYIDWQPFDGKVFRALKLGQVRES